MKRTLSALALAAVLLTGCSGLSKMKSSSHKIRYQANPDPVETMDDKVVVKFTGQVPEKYFNKKCAMFLQPVFSWEGGSIPLEPITLKGEKVDGDGGHARIDVFDADVFATVRMLECMEKAGRAHQWFGEKEDDAQS